MRRIAVLFLWLLASALALEVRVLLAETSEGEVVLPGGHAVWGPAGAIFSKDGPGRYRVRLERGQIWLEGRALGRRVSFVPKGGDFLFGSRRYPGFLRLVVRDDRLLWINVVEIEDYLEGVLPGEMPAWFPLEAQKAQAVIARTYAIERLGSHPDYDLCASSRCQVYLGRAEASSAYRPAIRASRGYLLAYQGRPVKAVYHADSGGMTASSQEVWGKRLPYLRARPDPYTRARSWQRTPSPAQVEGALAELGTSVGTFYGFQVLSRTTSDRIGGLLVWGSGGQVELGLPEVTRFLRALGLPSTMAWVEDGRRFSGRGLGHGVGLSQWGARGLARRGYDYREILGHYYPGTVLAPYQVKALK